MTLFTTMFRLKYGEPVGWEIPGEIKIELQTIVYTKLLSFVLFVSFMKSGNITTREKKMNI